MIRRDPSLGKSSLTIDRPGRGTGAPLPGLPSRSGGGGGGGCCGRLGISIPHQHDQPEEEDLHRKRPIGWQINERSPSEKTCSPDRTDDDSAFKNRVSLSQNRGSSQRVAAR